jgi:hypothetical protein
MGEPFIEPNSAGRDAESIAIPATRTAISLFSCRAAGAKYAAR